MIKNTFGLSPGLFKIYYALMTCMIFMWFAVPITFILKILGVKYLPHPEPLLGLPIWSYWVFGAVLAMPISGLAVIYSIFCFSESEIKIGFINLFVAFFFMFLMGFFGNIFFGATIPMLHTTIFGEEGHIEYEMRDSYDRYGSYSVCTGGVAVETKVIRHSILCGMEVKGNYSPSKGVPITVYGRASRAGIFYTSFKVGPHYN